jgi:cell division protein FtsL
VSAKSQRADKGAKGGARWWRWLLLPVFVAVAFAVCVYTYFPVAKVQYNEARAKARLEVELSQLQARNTHLRTEVARLKTPEGVEDYARVQLGMVKQGENVVIVVDGSRTASESVATSATIASRPDNAQLAASPAGSWTAFLDSVFGRQ